MPERGQRSSLRDHETPDATTVRAEVSSPEVLEPVRRQLGVAHRVLDVAVTEVSLQRSRIVALVGQRKATGVAQHVRMSRRRHGAFTPCQFVTMLLVVIIGTPPGQPNTDKV